MVICYLGVGTNLGERRKNIKESLKKINALKDTQIMKASKIFEFPPAGGPGGQRDYLNSVLKIKTKFSPTNLLKELKKIEKTLGRTKSVRFGPRVIDLDILLYGDKIIQSKTLTIPHARMFERDFVIQPLKQVL